MTKISGVYFVVYYFYKLWNFLKIYLASLFNFFVLSEKPQVENQKTYEKEFQQTQLDDDVKEFIDCFSPQEIKKTIKNFKNKNKTIKVTK